MTIVSPLIAEKLFVSIIILLFLGGCWRVAGAVDARSKVYALLVMPLAFHVLLQSGFFNYSLGAALALFAIASAWEGGGRSGWRPLVTTSVWLLLCYFAHGLPAMIACCSRS